MERKIILEFDSVELERYGQNYIKKCSMKNCDNDFYDKFVRVSHSFSHFEDMCQKHYIEESESQHRHIKMLLGWE